MKRILSLLSLSVLLFSSAWAQSPSSPNKEADVQTTEGKLAGEVDASGLFIFKGIPYAQPPVGKLRWHEPMAMKSWEGVRSAKQFGPRPIQPTLYKDMIFRSPSMSEDCLYLNVWTPQLANAAKLPVFVYIHGGGLITGDGSEPRYDGESMAKHGIVVVTVNYRLGVFGFMAHPELTKESKHHASGNYGLLDQHAALVWVKANIAAFGGDPSHITIGGQSAGSMSVAAHMASPLSKDLLAGAIGESGSVVGFPATFPLKDNEKIGIDFATTMSAKSLKELRAISAEKLFEATKAMSWDQFPLTLDHYFFSDAPTHIFATGQQADIPLLAGWNSAEINFDFLLHTDAPTPENYRAAVEKKYGENAAAVLKFYPGETNAEIAQNGLQLASDRLIVYNTWKWIDLHSKSSGSPVFRYYYTHPLPPETDAPDQKVTDGARHSSEIAYAMGNLSLLNSHVWTKDDFKVSETMQNYFVNFIKTGNPNGAGLPHWPWFQASIPHVMFIDVDSQAKPEPNSKRFQFWDSLYYR